MCDCGECEEVRCQVARLRSGDVRSSVRVFSRLMEVRHQRANDHKGGWHGMTYGELLIRLAQETNELSAAIVPRLRVCSAALP